MHVKVALPVRRVAQYPGRNDGDRRRDRPAEGRCTGAAGTARPGYRRLDQLAEVQESELLKLHGIGLKAMTILRAALEDRDLSFRDG
jgi:hypothetical protein